jgi:Flp pilus assembly protein TadD
LGISQPFFSQNAFALNALKGFCTKVFKLSDSGRFFYFFLLLIIISLPVFGGGYDPGALSESDLRAVRGFSSYARARYLIAERSNDIERISDHLRDCLIALPDSELPLRLLLFLHQGQEGSSALIDDLAPVVAANPEHLQLNIVYAEFLADAKRTDEACRHLLEFIEHSDWSLVEPVISLLGIKSRLDAWPEVADIIRIASRKKKLRNHPRLKIYQAYFLLQQATLDSQEKDELELARRKAGQLIQPFLDKPEKLHDWEQLASILPVLVEMENWSAMNQFLDTCPEDFSRTSFWFKNKLLVLVKLEDIGALTRLSSEIFSASQVSEELVEDLARAFIDLKEFGKAQEIYELLHLRNTRSLHYRLQLAWLYLMRGADNKGLALLAPVKKLPTRGLMLKAGLLRQRKQYQQAVEVYQQTEKEALAAEEIHYLDSSFYLIFAFAAENAGQKSLAIEKFRHAHQLDPDAPDICNALGYTLADHNQDLHTAEELIEKAVLAEPNNIAFLDSLAWVRFKLKNYQGALEAMMMTLTEFKPGLDHDGIIHQHAGEILEENEFQILAELYKRKASWERTRTHGHTD